MDIKVVAKRHKKCDKHKMFMVDITVKGDFQKQFLHVFDSDGVKMVDGGYHKYGNEETYTVGPLHKGEYSYLVGAQSGCDSRSKNLSTECTDYAEAKGQFTV